MALTLPNGVRYTIMGVWTNGRPVLTTWHAIVVPTGPRLQAVVNGAAWIGGQWATHVVVNMVNNYSFQRIAYVDLDSTAGSTGEWVLGSNTVGGSVNSSVPPSDGIMVTKVISDKGRGRRSGRVFIPGGSELAVDEDGGIQSGSQTVAEDSLTAFMVAVNGYTDSAIASLRLVVAHTPSEVVTVSKEVTRPLKTGVMSSSTITGFDSSSIVRGIRSRLASGL